MKIDQAILINISQKETIKRLSGRRVCNKCEQTYNINVMKPKKNGICDECGGKLIQRADDYPRAIKNRLAVYNQETKPVIEYNKKQGKLLKVNGLHPVSVVFKIILNKLKR